MRGDAMTAGYRATLLLDVERPDRAACEVVGVLETEQSDTRCSAVGPNLGEGSFDFQWLDNASIAFEQPQADSRVHCGTVQFSVNDVRVALREHLVAGPAMEEERDDVAHRPGGEEECGLFARQ